jgi:hypothetical protein
MPSAGTPTGTDAPTYHRCRDNGQHEIVVRARGGLWAFTATESDLPFDQYVSVHVDTGQFAVYTSFPAFFQALADRQPATLDEFALLLDGLGVADDTAGYERRRQQAAGWPEGDSWPHL